MQAKNFPMYVIAAAAVASASGCGMVAPLANDPGWIDDGGAAESVAAGIVRETYRPVLVVSGEPPS